MTMKKSPAMAKIQARADAALAARAARGQTELFDMPAEVPLAPAELAIIVDAQPVEQSNDKRERAKLLPVRHVDRDFFLCDMFDYAMKDDGASMEAPIFTLSTKPDLAIWNWSSKDGTRSLEVYPSVKGRATQFDKDVLI